MEYIKKAAVRGIIPFLIMTGISLMMMCQGMDGFQVKSTFISGLIITSLLAASVVYDVEGWPLLKQSAAHFLIMLATVLPCLIVSGWYVLESFADYLKLFVQFVFVGAILWSVSYIVFGKLIKS